MPHHTLPLSRMATQGVYVGLFDHPHLLKQSSKSSWAPDTPSTGRGCASATSTPSAYQPPRPLKSGATAVRSPAAAAAGALAAVQPAANPAAAGGCVGLPSLPSVT